MYKNREIQVVTQRNDVIYMEALYVCRISLDK